MNNTLQKLRESRRAGTVTTMSTLLDCNELKIGRYTYERIDEVHPADQRFIPVRDTWGLPTSVLNPNYRPPRNNSGLH